MSKLLALDQASRISGWAFFDNGELKEFGKIVASDNDIGERLYKIRTEVKKLIDKFEIDEIVFEDTIIVPVQIRFNFFLVVTLHDASLQAESQIQTPCGRQAQSVVHRGASSYIIFVKTTIERETCIISISIIICYISSKRYSTGNIIIGSI